MTLALQSERGDQALDLGGLGALAIGLGLGLLLLLALLGNLGGQLAADDVLANIVLLREVLLLNGQAKNKIMRTINHNFHTQLICNY